MRTPAGYHNRWRVATPLPPDRTISFEITPEVAQSGDHVANHDAEDDEDQEQVMGDVQDSIAVGRTQRNSRKYDWLIANIIMAYALSVIGSLQT